LKDYFAGPPLLNERCTSLLRPPPRLRNDLYCVEWDVKVAHRLPVHNIPHYAWIHAFCGQYDAKHSSWNTRLWGVTTRVTSLLARGRRRRLGGPKYNDWTTTITTAPRRIFIHQSVLTQLIVNSRTNGAIFTARCYAHG